ncbi:MAG: TraB/GumN family protein [Thermoplasmata archaeon]|nr:MAG: TraB/GumN family protein [Thermoplasmata archaeon]
MITIIGVGHVFDISRPLEKVILERNPSVVCVELDPMRYQSLMHPGGRKDMPLPYRMLARLQERIAKKYGTQVGREMITAIETAKTLNAKLAFIDMDSSKTVSSFFKSMSRREKIKFVFALLSSFFVSKKRIEKELEKFEEGEEDYIEMFGREFPAAKRMIIDDRNRYMASAIKKINQEYENIVAVVGDGHVEGIRTLLEPMDLEIIRLSQLRKAQPEKVDEVTVSYTVSYDYY